MIYPDQHHPVEDYGVGETDVALVNGSYFRLQILDFRPQIHVLGRRRHRHHRRQSRRGLVSPMVGLAHGRHPDHDLHGPSYPCQVRGHDFGGEMLVWVILWLL